MSAFHAAAAFGTVNGLLLGQANDFLHGTAALAAAMQVFFHKLILAHIWAEKIVFGTPLGIPGLVKVHAALALDGAAVGTVVDAVHRIDTAVGILIKKRLEPLSVSSDTILPYSHAKINGDFRY